MNKDSKIYIAGHNGLLGSAIHRKLISEGYTNIITRPSGHLDLRDQQATKDFFYQEKPEYVFFAAAKAGGIMALNTYRAESIYDNLMMQTNVIHNAYLSGVKKLLFMASNCVYPKYCNKPLKEEYLLAGKLEPTTEIYAVAKIAGIKMCEAYNTQYKCNFITVLPVNMYGEGDSYDPQTSHVMPALLSKFKKAKELNSPFVDIWGTGGARREFLHSDDFADACLFLMLNYNSSEPVNLGTGEDISIEELALMIKEISGYKGELFFDITKPDGIQSKLFDVSKIHSLGWQHKIGLKEGITQVYNSL